MAAKSIRLSVPAGINQKPIRQALAIRCEVIGYWDLSWRTFSFKAGSTAFQSATTP